MRKFYIFFFILFLITHIFPAINTNSVAVIGFLNKGDKVDNDYNTIITHSLNNFLSRIGEIEVVNPDMVKKVVEEKKLLETDSLNIETALDIGVSFSAGNIIVGEYLANRKTKKINITMFVYNVITSEMRLKRTYTENLGPDIFDTVDKMITTVGSHLLSKPIKIGKLLVRVGSDEQYELYINNKFQRLLDQKEIFSETMLAEANTVVVLKKLPEKEIVYSNVISIKSDETYNIFYLPTANLIINSKGFEGSEIILDDIIMGKVDNEGMTVLSNIQINKTIKVGISKERKILTEKEVKLDKAKDYFLDFSRDKTGVLSEKSVIKEEKSSDLTLYLLGKSAGKLRAQQVGGFLWMGGSCAVTLLASSFINLFGFIPGALIVAWAYNSNPKPPVEDFIGKDERYISGYKEGFQSEIKNINLINSSIGCFIGGTTGTLLWILIFSKKG